MNKKFTTFFAGVIVLSLALVLTTTFFAQQLLFSGVSQDSTEILFDVYPGQTMFTVTNNLENMGLIKNKWLFYQYARLLGANARLKKGEYSLNQTMPADQIISVITSGKSVARNMTIIEGSTIYDVADVIEKLGIASRQDVLILVRDPVFIRQALGETQESLEGYLFPETYKVTKFDTLKDTLMQMTRRFLVVWSEFDAQARAIGWPRHKVITLASIVEKETGHEKDRTIVSSVFHNRIAKKMRLQTDPTVLYGLAVEKGFMPNNISKKDLQTPNRFNTYTIASLPPTPISNPGRMAIMATLNPARTNYLYFVSRNDGTTAFSESLVQHNKSVDKYQRNPKAREGKSWRDLKNKK